MLLYLDDEKEAALRLAAAADVPAACIERHRFPDGELKLRLPAQLPERTMLYRSLDNPNEKLVELLIAAQTARTLGARHLDLVAPTWPTCARTWPSHPVKPSASASWGASWRACSTRS
ncbi:MAG: ribose-phosphate pyrophosphokinase-like domain-containing protein [Rhodoferax sp.]